jgi:release factor glutamine methyltransferase
MQLKELRDKMVQELGVIYPERECYNLVNSLVFSIAGIEKKDIAVDPGKLIGEDVENLLYQGLHELMGHKPLQYVTGLAYFYGLDLAVNPSVLIPRPETEELVKWIGDDYREKTGLKVLDIGTGSGCIILALGKLLMQPRLTAVDISEHAIRTASGNAGKYGIEVEFIKVNILNENEWNELGTFDIMVSNPPYVRESEKSGMQANVVDYEPPEALFVPDNDPLIFYRAIVQFSRKHLSANGKLYLEINENLGKEAVNLIKNEGYTEIILKKDMHGKDRMIRCGGLP